MFYETNYNGGLSARLQKLLRSIFQILDNFGKNHGCLNAEQQRVPVFGYPHVGKQSLHCVIYLFICG
jgi:hypothetical protein